MPGHRLWRGIFVRLGAIAMALTSVVQAQEVRLQPAANNQVAIPRVALGKEFMLTASVIPQSVSPTSQGLAGRIVTFELFHDGVDLYEATQGQVVTTELPARRLLTTFPIVAQDENNIVIDFNRGMNRVVTEGWYSSNRYNPEDLSRVAEITHSRVFAVETAANRLVVRQAAQLRDRQSDPNQEARFEIRYFISPYQASDVPAKENLARDARYVQFFQSQPQLELTTGRASAKIARFDIRQPVTFHYSANTPAEYVQATIEGILYWNRAFGREVVKAEKAPDGVTAPHPDYNVVQWVPWDSAGSAYADVLIDPRTGRSLHGQAYITSTFAFGGKQRARAILRMMRSQMKEEKKEGEKKQEPRFGAGFWKPVCSCECDQHEFARHMVHGLEAMLCDADASDAHILTAAQDYVRNVVAHEVGHVLGLRHNFAGSVEATVTPAELEQWFTDYLTKEQPPEMKDKFTTSSVMEYSVFQAAVFNGWKIRTTQEVLPHDKAAIQWGYADSPEAKEKKLLFGTDDSFGTYGDVRPFDYGSEPIVGAFAELSADLKRLPNEVIESFIDFKAPLDPRDRRPLEEVNLNPALNASMLAASYSTMFRWFQAGTRSIRLERDLPFVGELNGEELLDVRWDKLNEEVKKVGGVDRLAFSFLPVNLTLDLKDTPKDLLVPEKFDVDKMTARLGELLDSPAYTNFVGADGQTYSFTPEEKELIKKRGKLFFEEFQKVLLQRACEALGRASRDLGVRANGTVSDDDIVAQLEKQVINLGRAIILAKDESKTRRGKINKSVVEVTEFLYDGDTRLAAAQMLGDAVGSYRSWSRDARGALHNELKAEVEAALNINNFKAFNETQLSRPLRDWFLEQQKVLALLPPLPPGPGGPGPGGPAPPGVEEQAPAEPAGS